MHAPEGFAGWGTLALINAGIAQGKNRSGLNWFLISILLGPVATLILVAFFAKRLPTCSSASGEASVRPAGSVP